jgi:diguanylate cyclase (GGDEF)-like protein
MVSLYVSEAENIQFKVKMSILATFCLSIVTLAIIWKFMLRPFARELEEKAHEVEFMSEKLKSAAVHDSLTGLPNRTFMREHIERELANAKRHASKLAIVHLDLDFFKEINDTYGHSAGDQTLVETGKRIQSCIRTNDIVSRVGGDEFVLILSDFDDIGTVNIVLQRIRQRVSEPFIYEGASLQMSCSMGVAIYPDDAVTGDELIVNADLALYQVKEIGRGDFAFFSQGMRDELERRKTVELDLKDAVEKQELVPHFQPQVCVKTSRIIGVEALVRWEHSERGNIAPAEFLPVAEASGIMPKLGRSVMRMAMETAAKWHNEGLEMGRIGLNVSSPELAEPDFADWIINTAAEIGLPTSKISIEIIETVMLDDQRLDASRKLQQLRDADIHVELDDFGTGYASLCQINAGEVDRLKIDRQFVKNIDSDGDNAKIVGAVVRLATGLGIDIVAEGAETPSEVERLKELGCDRIQGFGIALPMPAKEASEWIGAFSKGRSTRKRALKKIA